MRSAALAAELARRAADELSTPAKPRFVAGSMGPTTKSLTVTGGTTFDELRDNYHEQARGLIDGGADILLLETCQDTRNIKAGALAIQQLGARTRPQHSADGFRDDRADGHDARRTGRRSAVGFARSPQSAVASG